MSFDSKKFTVAIGLLIGIISAMLVKFGNPANMGFCIACFIRDTAGALGLHGAKGVQYIRPEIIGLVLGSFAAALFSKEFKARGGSAPMTRFILGFFVMVGALMFLGCPFRMVLRIAGGDLNAVVGLVGFAAGILCGVFFLNKGFSLKRSYTLSACEGTVMPVIQAVFLALLIAAPTFILFTSNYADVKGPGKAHAAIIISLAAGLIVGILAQKSRFCMVGGLRDLILFREARLILGFAAIAAAACAANVAMGSFTLGFENQPVAHTDALWNFLGMLLVGFASVLLGGCPLRQLILSGEGNTDSAVTSLGLLVGAAFCHNFALASSAAGPTPNGKVAVIIGIVVAVAIAFANLSQKQEA
ncbi:MAG: YedE family putative selenium transporter [Synergistes sp.]|nr:YedE family putative selenium transporter [Synergistes sp.]